MREITNQLSLLFLLDVFSPLPDGSGFWMSWSNPSVLCVLDI